MNYFGDPWGPPEMADSFIPTPVGEVCLHCDERIAEADRGVVMPFLGPEGARTAAMHRECFLRGVVGSVGHQLKTCSCYGGASSHRSGLSRREEARAACRAAGVL